MMCEDQGPQTTEEQKERRVIPDGQSSEETGRFRVAQLLKDEGEVERRRERVHLSDGRDERGRARREARRERLDRVRVRHGRQELGPEQRDRDSDERADVPVSGRRVLERDAEHDDADAREEIPRERERESELGFAVPARSPRPVLHEHVRSFARNEFTKDRADARGDELETDSLWRQLVFAPEERRDLNGQEDLSGPRKRSDQSLCYVEPEGANLSGTLLSFPNKSRESGKNAHIRVRESDTVGDRREKHRGREE